MRYWCLGLILASWLCLNSCSSQEPEMLSESVENTLFEPVPASWSGVEFSNDLTHTERLNTYTYRNFYNGAGVAVGDVNNDGLPDLYIAGNQVPNKLYLNRGDFTFVDITAQAGVACTDVWSTGVSMADVNGDGWTDIYVCKSGPPEGPNRNNELFINNGDSTFTERAAVYGIDDRGLSNHAVFLDYDLDGDLDMYLLNNSMRSVGIYDLRQGQREIRDPEGGNKLYRNDGQSFTDVSEEAGIYGSAIGFGLGVTAADINKDGWPDIFVSNDFFERDYLYVNQQDGTFREVLEEFMNETSMGSMGADIADLTNDGYPEVYVTEMLPASLERVKTKTVFEDWDKYQSDVENGYYHQFTRNVLQLNNGPVPGQPGRVSFSEISRFTGTEATDWSWGALIFDANNDGHKDIFVANGIYKDLTDQDYINFYSNTELRLAKMREDSTVLTSLIDKIPSVPLTNHFFLNRGGLRFQDAVQGSGLEDPGFSNGAVYADLDNDGDLDLVVNNINAPLSIYRNLTRERGEGNYIQVKLSGPGANTDAFGTQVYAYAGEDLYYAEQQPVKGYMSTMDSRLHFGVGDHLEMDSILIVWPDQTVTQLRDVPANQMIMLDHGEVERTISGQPVLAARGSSWLVPASIPGLDTVSHHENDFVDFNRDRLLFEMYSNEGPPAVSGDVNGDLLEDVLLGGSSGYSTRLFFQYPDGRFREQLVPAFIQDKMSEDTDLRLADIDLDGDLDLVAASGGNEFSYSDRRWLDRLYVNDGKGNFTSRKNFISNAPRTSTAFMRPLDYDLDGDLDLLCGARLEPFSYGIPVSARLLENDGNGIFSDVTANVAPGMIDIGLLTDAVIIEHESNRPEIILTGEWMRPVRFVWKDNQFVRETLSAPSGLYKSALGADVNQDGNMDIILGNYGTNTRFDLSEDRPLTMFVGDFDKNGSVEHITSVYSNDTLFPLVLLQDLSRQMPVVRKNYPTFDDYKDASVQEIISGMEQGIILEAASLASGILLAQEEGGYVWKPFPAEAQFSPIHSIYVTDLNNDGNTDIILAGNQRRAKPELGIYDGSYGVVLSGDGTGDFEVIPHHRSGFWVRGEVRSILAVKGKDQDYLLVVRNNDQLMSFGKL